MSRNVVGSRQDGKSARRRQFGSDNYAGICPEAWNALVWANAGHAIAYGDDEITARAVEQIRQWFETDCDVFFTLTGTGANALAVSAMCDSFHAVVCHEHSHLATDECGAAEFFTGGARLLPIGGEQAKLSPDDVVQRIEKRHDVHFSKVRAISITQATEAGTVYSVEEVTALAEIAKRYDLGLHMDGARFSNAIASLHQSPADVTWRAGVDILSLGGTKIGLPVGEALVFFDKHYARDFGYRRKQSAQLCSKMRFIAAPWIGLLDVGFSNSESMESGLLPRGPLEIRPMGCGASEEAPADDSVPVLPPADAIAIGTAISESNRPILRHARNANHMANRLRAGLEAIDAFVLPFPTQANAVFVEMSVGVQRALFDRGWKFYALIGETTCRLMCAWDTTSDDVDQLLADIREVIDR